MLFLSMTLLPAMNASGAGRHEWAPMNCANLYGGGDGGVCAPVCARARTCMRDVLQYTIIIFDPG